LSARTSHDRKPCSNIMPTMARSREVRKLDQKRAASSIDEDARKFVESSDSRTLKA
jgi:hypothetical protein